MQRNMFPTEKIDPKILAKIQSYQNDILAEIKKSIEENDVVIVGMSQNPFVNKARRYLSKAGIPFKYLEYGNYFNNYDLRVAIKMWTGWHLFPQIFVKGIFIGGCEDMKAELDSGEFHKRLGK